MILARGHRRLRRGLARGLRASAGRRGSRADADAVCRCGGGARAAGGDRGRYADRTAGADRHGGRAAENAVRPLLGARQSSVFSVPSRAAMQATDYREACGIALATSEPPRKISKQLFNIAPKIREVDAALRADAPLASRTFEVHPEVAFWRLNGERPLAEPKKVKGAVYPPGLALRRKLLRAAGLPVAAVEAPPPRGAGADDLLDALACVAVARRLHAGLARPFPDPPPLDRFDLRMAIWA